MLTDKLLIEKEDNKCFVYINGKKVDIEETNFFQVFNKNIDKEFNSEIMDLLAGMPDKLIRQSVKIESKIDIYINTINEISKTVYGITVGKTLRPEAFHIVKNILKNEYCHY